MRKAVGKDRVLKRFILTHAGTHQKAHPGTQPRHTQAPVQPLSHRPGTAAARGEVECRVRTEHRGWPVYISCSNNTHSRGTWVRQGVPQLRTSRPAGRQAPGAAVEACGVGARRPG